MPIVSSNPRSVWRFTRPYLSVLVWTDIPPGRSLDLSYHRFKILECRCATLCEPHFPRLTYFLIIKTDISLFPATERRNELPRGIHIPPAPPAFLQGTLYSFHVRRRVPLFARAMDVNLDVGWASTLLALLACAFVPIPVLLYKYDERIRMASKRAPYDFE